MSKKNKKPVVGEDDPNETIWLSCKLGDIDAVKARLALGTNVNRADSFGNTPLYYACLCGRYKMVEYLLCQGAHDDGVQRAYYNALTIEIRHLLKGKATTFRRDTISEPQPLKPRDDEDEVQPYNFTVLLPIGKSKMDESFSPMSPGVSQFFTDVVVKSHPKLQPQKEYKCHLCILLPRLYYIFDKYFRDVNYNDEEGIQDIIETKLKDKTITLHFRYEVVGMILKYLYTNDDTIFYLSKGFELDLIQALFDVGLNKEAKTLMKKVDKKFETKFEFPSYTMAQQFEAGMTTENRKKFSKKAIEKQIDKELEKQIEDLKKKKKPPLSEKHIKKYREDKYQVYAKSSGDRIKLEHVMRCLSDVKVYGCDSEKFIYCHKAILAARSAYFNILLGGYFSDVGEENSLEISFDALETVIFFIYTDRCVIGSTAIDVLTAAHQLNLDGLKKKAGDFIGKNLDENNAFDLFKLSDMCNAPKLKLLCTNFFATPQYQINNKPDLIVYSNDNTKFMDYKCLWASHSKYFFQYFFYDEEEHNEFVCDLSASACDWFLRGYTGKITLVDCPPNELCELLKFGDQFGFDMLGKKSRLAVQSTSKPIEMLYYLFLSKSEDHYLYDDLCHLIVQKYYGKYSAKTSFKEVMSIVRKTTLKTGEKQILQSVVAKFTAYVKLHHPELNDKV